jgi:Secretion system C-terminal sorting domain
MRSITSFVMILILVCTFSAFAETVSVNSGQAVPASDHPSSYDGTPTIPHMNELDEAYVCLIKDVNGWSNADEEILISMAPDVTYDLITSSQIATTDFSDYTFVLVAGNQNPTFNQNVLDNIGLLEEYVDGGGWLEFHMATNSHTPAMMLWDGTTYSQDDYQNENFMGPDGLDHPALEGVAEPYPGSSTNHGYVTNFPLDAAVIVVTGSGNPTYIEYGYGAGNVVVTTMTMEYLWQNFNDTSGQILWNTINYMANRPPAGPVQIEIIPDNPPISVPQGGSFTFGVHITSEYPPTTQAWVWTVIEFPNGQQFGPIAQARPNIFFGMDVWVTNISQTMPINSPVGQYRYYVNAGLNLGNALIYDYFRFDVTPALAGATGGYDWTSTGLEQLNEIAGEESATLTVPVEFELAQVYPNPFNPTANVSVVLPSATQLTVGVYNVMGQQVAELTSGQLSAGTHNFVLDGSNLSSGVYFVRAMTSNGDAGMQKVMLMK